MTVPMTQSSIVLTSEIMGELRRIVLYRLPSEACGLLLPSPRGHGSATQVVELPNRSPIHRSGYAIDPDDVYLEIEAWMEGQTEEEIGRVAVWHSHPKGHVGPSKGDLNIKEEGVPYLVLAVQDNQIIPCWF